MEAIAYLAVFSVANFLLAVFSATKTGSKLLGGVVAIVFGGLVIPMFDFGVTQVVFRPVNAPGDDVVQVGIWLVLSAIVIAITLIGLWATK